jgi:hypothetical protein
MCWHIVMTPCISVYLIILFVWDVRWTLIFFAPMKLLFCNTSCQFNLLCASMLWPTFNLDVARAICLGAGSFIFCWKLQRLFASGIWKVANSAKICMNYSWRSWTGSEITTQCKMTWADLFEETTSCISAIQALCIVVETGVHKPLWRWESVTSLKINLVKLFVKYCSA